jgi:acyl phosphate:glycerol-3-phosphate acyltransferase
MSAAWPILVGGALAYLVGSIPFGFILTNLAGLGDIRAIGSGNIGATNVLRTGHKGLAVLTLLLDAGKGAVAVLVARRFGPDMVAAAALGAVLGHLFPVWLRFKGGKGVATAGGVLLAYLWPVGVAAGLTWLAIVAVSRYSSLAAIAAAVLAPLYAWGVFHGTRQEIVVVSCLAFLVLFRHGDNMRRLARGEESKINLH